MGQMRACFCSTSRLYLTSSKNGLNVDVQVDGRPLHMQLDTGASVTVVSEKTWHELFPNRPVNQSLVKLKTYTGEPLAVLGEGEVEVTYGKQVCHLPLIVVGGGGLVIWAELARTHYRGLGVHQGHPHGARSATSET